MILVWHDLGYEMTNNLHLNFYFMISSCIYQYLLVSCHFSIYHKISYCIHQYRNIFSISSYIIAAITYATIMWRT